MRRKKIVYVISDINKSLAFEWLVQDWDYKSNELYFILINGEGTTFKDFLIKNRVPTYSLRYNGFIMMIPTIFKIVHLLRKVQPTIVHCHLLNAGLLGMMAAVLSRVRRRIYTRHHGSFHHEYHPKGVVIDKLINYLATDIIAISENVKDILIHKDRAKPTKIHLIHHGFKLDFFLNGSTQDIEIVGKRYNSLNKWPVIGVISRFFELKGIQYIIPAFAKLLKYYPNAYLILANARGPYKEDLLSLLEKIDSSNYKLIEFEEDIFSLYKLFTIHVHAPVNRTVEAFGQTYVEALASGIPSIFTLSGVGSEYLESENNCLLVNHRDSEGIFDGMKRLIEDESLRNQIVDGGRQSIQRFEFSNMMRSLNLLYAR